MYFVHEIDRIIDRPELDRWGRAVRSLLWEYTVGHPLEG